MITQTAAPVCEKRRTVSRSKTLSFPPIGKGASVDASKRIRESRGEVSGAGPGGAKPGSGFSTDAGNDTRLGIEIPKLAQGFVVGLPNDDVVEDFDFQKLSGTDEVASDFDVRFAWTRVAARVVVK
jgi:hypothetical protein